MYFPYLRGKRHELSALRRISSLLDPTKIRPIIEPVNVNTSELTRTIRAINIDGHIPLIIVNPLVGQLVNSMDILALTHDATLSFLPCIAFSHQNFSSATRLSAQFVNDNVNYATYFKDEPAGNITAITSRAVINTVFSTQSTSAQFLANMPRLVKVQDFFNARSRNADYPTQPYNYSDAHLIYNNLPNAIGFGDFQIVGEAYSDDGGPARAVAIHITYINTLVNDQIYIKHCVSTLESDTTSNTGRKFLQALDDVINFANVTNDVCQLTEGFVGLVDYHNRQHYPNLGPIKECSIMHHIESIERYL